MMDEQNTAKYQKSEKPNPRVENPLWICGKMHNINVIKIYILSNSSLTGESRLCFPQSIVAGFRHPSIFIFEVSFPCIRSRNEGNPIVNIQFVETEVSFHLFTGARHVDRTRIV